MGHWVAILRFIQVGYLLIVTILIFFYTGMIAFSKLDLGDDELYQEYLEDFRLNNAAGVEPTYSKHEIVFTNYFIKFLVIAVLPASVLIYRSRLLTLQAFVTLKKHQGNRQGLAYNRCLQQLDKLFCLSRLQKKNYIQYIMYKNKNR